MAVHMPPTIPPFPEKFEKLTISRFLSEDRTSVPSTPSTPTSPPPEPYQIRLITQQDEEPVLNFLRRFFFRDEPVNVSVGLLDRDGERCLELEDYSIKCIRDRISLMAITDSQKIVGVSLNGKMYRDEPEMDCDYTDEKFLRIIRLLNYVDREADVFGKFPDVDKLLLVKILSVDNTWRGKGIGRYLMDRTRELAREEGFKLMRVDCTSAFSAKATAKLGFDLIYSLNYKDYKEHDEVVIVPEKPHDRITVFVQRINAHSTP